MKPCPFCGAPEAYLRLEPVPHGTIWASSVVCRMCGAVGPWRKGETPDAADALARREWDKRVPA